MLGNTNFCNQIMQQTGVYARIDVKNAKVGNIPEKIFHSAIEIKTSLAHSNLGEGEGGSGGPETGSGFCGRSHFTKSTGQICSLEQDKCSFKYQNCK